MNIIEVNISNKKVGELFFENKKKEFGFNYTDNTTPISLIMPYKNSTYIWKDYLHPIFDMNIHNLLLMNTFV